jgi:hypothetical protein
LISWNVRYSFGTYLFYPEHRHYEGIPTRHHRSHLTIASRKAQTNQDILVQPFKGPVPEYPGWFEPFVMQWLNENDDVSLEFLHSAYARDKKDKFQKNTEHPNFSNSVVDVFTQLTQCFRVLQKLECQDPEIWKRYMKRFAKTVVKVITAYSDLLKNDFPNHVKDEPTVIIYKDKDKFREIEFSLVKINFTKYLKFFEHLQQVLE